MERADIDDFMGGLVRAELGKDDDDPLDEYYEWDLNYPRDIALESWSMLRNHGIMLEPGALMDQDPKWLADVRTLNGRYNAAARRVKDDEPPDLDDYVDDDAPGLEDVLS